MAHNLPDELIKEILAPGLRVPDDVFASTSRKSPFAETILSSSSVLSVCKRWLRVATPLLYEVVVLRSKAQAQALEAVLRANKQLGTYIKKLRLEGGYGATVHTVFSAAPNITDLFLSLSLRSSDSVSGIGRSLGSLNPKRVFVNDGEFLNNAVIRQLVDKLCTCIRTWNSMESFHLYSLAAAVSFGERSSLIAKALSDSQSLHNVFVSLRAMSFESLQAVSKNPSVKQIHIDTTHRTGTVLSQSLARDNHLRSLITYAEPRVDPMHTNVPIPSIVDTSYIPMASAPGPVKELVWSEVIRHAMRFGEEHSYFDRKHILNTRKSLLLVSKTFHRLAIPLLYGSPSISSPTSLRQFATRLKEEPSLGLHIRNLWFGMHIGTPESSSADSPYHVQVDYEERAAQQKRMAADHIYEIIMRAHNLAQIGMQAINPFAYQHIRVPWVGFLALADTAGNTLVTLDNMPIQTPSRAQSAAVFGAFKRLVSLHWECPVKFSSKADEVSRDCLASLECLTIVSAHASFLTLLSYMSLPAIRIVAISNITPDASSFFKEHGSKIQELETKGFSTLKEDYSIFDRCPELAILTMTTEVPPDPFVFICAKKHTYLRKLVLYARHRSFEKHGDRFIKNLNVEQFPELREIQINSCVWPTTEHAINKSKWVGWAEYLLTLNVQLVDAQGKGWRPRLKASSGRR